MQQSNSNAESVIIYNSILHYIKRQPTLSLKKNKTSWKHISDSQSPTHLFGTVGVEYFPAHHNSLRGTEFSANVCPAPTGDAAGGSVHALVAGERQQHRVNGPGVWTTGVWNILHILYTSIYYILQYTIYFIYYILQCLTNGMNGPVCGLQVYESSECGLKNLVSVNWRKETYEACGYIYNDVQLWVWFETCGVWSTAGRVILWRISMN